MPQRIIITRGLSKKIEQLVAYARIINGIEPDLNIERGTVLFQNEARWINLKIEIDHGLVEMLTSFNNETTPEQNAEAIKEYLRNMPAISTDATQAAQHRLVSINDLRNLISDLNILPEIISFGFLFFIDPKHATFQFANFLVNAAENLSPDAQSVLKSILYPTLLYVDTETTANIACVYAVQAALEKINRQVGAQTLYIVLTTVNSVLVEYAPNKLLEAGYASALEEIGPSLHVAVGAGTLFTQYFNRFTESRFFKRFESFCDEMTGAPEEAPASVAP